MKKKKLSVVLSTKNEEENIGPCLESIKDIADEIIIFDEESKDKTREIAQKYGAKVTKVVHVANFHITKQKAIDAATGDWILQLDADERVSPDLAKEIVEVINSNEKELLKRVLSPTFKKLSLFIRHQRLIEEREGHLGKPTGKVVAFFVPRRNFFLGAPLIHAGVYPDGVIRLIKRGFARLPAKSVHELMEIDGEVSWLFNDLEHHDSPTLKRYLDRMNRYTDLHAQELKDKKVPTNYWNLFKYSFLLPTSYFLRLYFRHLGFLDGMRGFIWSVFSALHYPIAYFKYYQSSRKD
jgi:glycosyltransferase involved in cell wall biosynthesis